MFIQSNFTRGILILEPLSSKNDDKKTGIYLLPSIKNVEQFTKVLNEIKQDLEN